MFRIPIIYIVAGKDDLKLQIYNNVKHAIPECLKKDYAYCGQGLLQLPLMDDSDEYAYVVEMSKKHNLHATPRERSIYTKQEEEQCEFFMLSLFTPLENNGVALHNFGTTFDSDCSYCNTRKKLIGSALIERNFIKHKDIVLLSNSIVAVSESLKNVMVENKFTGIDYFHEIKDYKGRYMDKYYCIAPSDNILQPMHNETWLIPWEEEKICGHSQFYLFSNPKYYYKDLKDAKDFNYSMETDCGIDGNRFIIISKKVRDTLRKHKFRAWFVPVDIIK